MSDDVFEAFGDDDIFEEDDELDQAQGDAQNRTFIIAVAVLGGLLVCALVSFGVWAIFLNGPRQAVPASVDVVATETSTPTATPVPPTDTPAPTDTPEPTATPLLGPTPTAPDFSEEVLALDETAGQGAATATPEPRRSPTPTATRRVTPTPNDPAGTSANVSGQLSQTGLGEWVLVGAAVFLLAIMVLARRLRNA